MDVKLYQINLDRDTEKCAFLSIDSPGEKTDTPMTIDSTIYDCVFTGEVDAASLEDVFAIFNMDQPEGYHGRSMSVSDVVVASIEGKEEAAYFCNSIGFVPVKFDESRTGDAINRITVVLVEPGKIARRASIDCSLEGLQQVVGGCIEPYYPFEEDVCIVCNDEGKLIGLPLNRAVYAQPEQVELPYAKMKELFSLSERTGLHMEAYITFTQSSFPREYSEKSRTYVISSNNKAFQPGKAGYSIFGSCLDGTDNNVRLERYMADERGGEDGWQIERCYFNSSREIMDVIAGTFFICDCSGENFNSLTEEQVERYTKEFELPEYFIQHAEEIEAVPYRPDPSPER